MQSKEYINGLLIEKYSDAVDIGRLKGLAEKSPQLAGLFVSGVTESYLTSQRKIMIVGKETRGWGKGLPEVMGFPASSAYMQHVIQRHADLLRRPPPSSKFFQFYRDISRRIAEKKFASMDAVVWANLFCSSYRSGSPVGCADSFEEVKELSRTLLRIQVEVLQPDAILFVTGASYDKYIKHFFEISDSERLVPRSLWSFKVDGIQAYRTSHPQWEKGREFRERALALAMRMDEDDENGQRVARRRK